MPRSAVTATLLLFWLAAPAAADTRSGLMLRPMPEDRAAQLRFEIDQYAEAHADAVMPGFTRSRNRRIRGGSSWQ